MLAVLASGVVLAADARDDVQVVDVAAAVGVAVALTVWKKHKDRDSVRTCAARSSPRLSVGGWGGGWEVG